MHRNGEGHMYVLKTDHICSLKFRMRKLTDWYSMNTIDLCPAGTEYESQPRHQPP
jgi:hypothetical protein